MLRFSPLYCCKVRKMNCGVIAFIFKFTYSNKKDHKPVIDKMHNNINNYIFHNCTAAEITKGDGDSCYCKPFH